MKAGATHEVARAAAARVIGVGWHQAGYTGGAAAVGARVRQTAPVAIVSAQRTDPVAGLVHTDASAGAQDLTRGARASAGRAIAGGRPPEWRRTGLARRAAGGDVRIVDAHVTTGVEPIRTGEAA
jgi:hypothetical protein